MRKILTAMALAALAAFSMLLMEARAATVTLTPAQLVGLTITIPVAGVYLLDVVVNSPGGSTPAVLIVTVNDAVVPPILTVGDAAGLTGEPIPLNILTDAESITITIPDGATLSSGAGVGSSSGLLFRGDFESGDLDAFGTELCCIYSAEVVTSPVRGGNYAVRFELRKDDPIVARSKRAELKVGWLDWPLEAKRTIGGVGDERWYGISIYVPSDFEPDTTSEVVMQWHSRPDGYGGGGGTGTDPNYAENCEPWRSPPLGLFINGNNFEFQIRYDSNACSGSNISIQKKISVGTIEKGKWIDWVLHIKWSYQSDGFMQVWKDGIQVVDYNGPNVYNDEQPLYFKFGIYKWPWKAIPEQSIVSTRVYYFDELRIGPAGAQYQDVAPSGSSLP